MIIKIILTISVLIGAILQIYAIRRTHKHIDEIQSEIDDLKVKVDTAEYEIKKLCEQVKE